MFSKIGMQVVKARHQSMVSICNTCHWPKRSTETKYKAKIIWKYECAIKGWYYYTTSDIVWWVCQQCDWLYIIAITNAGKYISQHTIAE